MNGIAISKMTFEEARQCADEIKIGISNIGQKLLQLYEGDGWEALGYSNWRECAQVEFGFKQSHVYRLLESAEVVRNIENSPIGGNVPLPTSERQARPLTKLDPELQPVVWQKAIETAPNGKVTAAHVTATAKTFVAPAPVKLQPIPASEIVRTEMRFVPAKPFSELDTMVDEAEGNEDGYDWQDEEDENTYTPPQQTMTQTVSKPHVAHNSGNNEWYTPEEYIIAARQVLGRIDLDPATSEIANRVVQADEYFTVDDNGLDQHWTGKVWMNPPYSSDLVWRFAEKLCAHYEGSDVTEAIVLVNNATETAWFQRMAQIASCICFPRTRVKFWKPDGETGAPLQGQAILYFGTKKHGFISAFRLFGFVGVINGIQ